MTLIRAPDMDLAIGVAHGSHQRKTFFMNRQST